MRKRLLFSIVALFTLCLGTWAQIASGSCGKYVTWSLDEWGKLIISGTGPMQNYPAGTTVNPWYTYRNSIKAVEIKLGVTSIGNEAFLNCNDLAVAIIPEGVTSIGIRAFQGCGGLTYIKIPSSVMSIGDNAFCGCSGLTSIEIPSSVMSIGDETFMNCSGLTSIEIPSSVMSIGDKTFMNCSGLTSIEIPSSVTGIGELAFKGCSGLGSIVVDSENPVYDSRNNCNAIIHTSTDKLRYGCEKTVIPLSVTSIDDNAFAACPGLISIKIPEGVKVIGEYAFVNCSYLSDIEIPEGLEDIGEGAFSGCSRLVRIELPSSVGYIADNTFYSSGLTSIELPSGITSIGEDAFLGCHSLAVVKMAQGVTDIGSGAFYGCSSLTSIELPSSVTDIGEQAFSNCSCLTLFSISNINPPEIYPNIYKYFDNIHKECVLQVPAGSIKAYQESGWAQYFGGGIKALEEETDEPVVDGIYYAFNEDGTSVSVTCGPDGEGTYSGNVTVPASVSIGGKPYSVTGIGENAFKGCSSLTSVTLPEGLKTIGIRGFDVCTSLESINFPSTLTSIGDYAFALCAALKGEIVLPAGVTSLPIGTFAYCESITSLTLPSTFKTIGIETFLHCKSLETVNLPNGLTGIGESAFCSCDKLASITLPQSLTDLGGNVFSGCSSLKSIAIPSGVKVIGRDAFASCTSLETVSLSEGLTEIGVNAFLDCKSLTSVTVPSSVTKVGEQAFKMCVALLKVTLPDALETIGSYVFGACINLKEVNTPSSLKQLPEGMFHDCCALEEVVIPASSTAIGINTFHNCQSLKNVTIPAGVTKIGACAFEWSGLTSVDIPETVTQIDEKAFSGCSALADVTVSWKEPISINENVFAESMKETLHVPSGTQSAYQQATGWKDFENIVSDDTEPGPKPETENAFVINDTKVMAGSAFTMPVELKNSCEVAAFQCDIYLSEGITLQKNNKNKYEITLDENRKDDHTITIAEQPDGAIRIVVASLSSSTFSGTEGTLLNMELLAAEDASGEKNIAIKNVYISEANGKRHDLADAEATVTIQTYTPADANNDGMIAIDDVVLTINAVLGNVSGNFVFDAADMNGDGQILIDDVVKVINAVLGINTSAVSNVRRSDFNETFFLNQKETGIGLSVSNAAGYTAMQYDMHLPEGADVADVRFTGKSNHKVTFRKMDENVVRVVVVSLTNEVFSGNELMDVVIDAAQDTEISITNASVVTRNGIKGNVRDASAKMGGNTTAIDLFLDGMARADVYDMNGRLVKKNAVTAAGLQKGAYIINGKKVVVK